MNYWLFQGNPKIYRVKDALKDEAIRSWKVSAHKGKIQSGDQVILWMTGREAGCYALAEVVSAVYFREDDEVEKLYYADNYADDAAGDAVEIKLLHNFWNRPVLWEKIRDLPEFNGFPAGRQGTNFQANKIQFEMIFELGKQNIQRSFFKYYPGEKAKHWQQDLATGEARIGYSELETGSMEQYATLGDLNMHLGLSPTNKSNKTWNLFLLKSAREGDVVFAAGGQSLVLGIGIIKDSYRYDGNNEYAHIRPVEWLTTDPW
ncbi:MAG: EVE domain-containing protein, partial [Saprospiraceae bacterium]